MKTKLLILLLSTSVFANDMCDFYYDNLQRNMKSFNVAVKNKMFDYANKVVVQMEHNAENVVVECKGNQQMYGKKVLQLTYDMKKKFGL